MVTSDLQGDKMTINRVLAYFRFTSVLKQMNIEPDSELAGRLRARQIRAMIQVTPLMMAANVANSVIVTFALYGKPGTQWLPLWTLLILAMAGIGLLNWNANRHRNIHSASPRAMAKAAKAAFALGCAWAIIPVLYFPTGDFQTRLLVCTLAAGMLGGGAMSLYAIPAAMFGFIGSIAAGAAIALLMASGDAAIQLPLIALLLSYVIAVFKSGHTLSTTFAQSIVSAIESREKTETISLLLKDFSENASDWLWQTNSSGQLVHGSKEFSENLGTIPTCFCHGDARVPDNFIKVKGASRVRDHWINREAFTDVQVSTTIDNRTNWVSISGKPLYDSSGGFVGFRGVAANITANKEAEERIAYLAHNDALTGLVNRTHFSRAISSHLANTHPDDVWAVMYLDLDGFKLVNDTMGHGVGDELLETVAQRIRKLCNEADVVARLGGDEFAILCRDGISLQALNARAEKLIRAVSASYSLSDNRSVGGIGVSIGIALGGRDGTTEQQLLHNADLALYRAKSQGKGIHRFFEVEMDDLVRERRMLERDLREALANKDFTLSYQPLVSAVGQHTEGFEALVRWNHPERGPVSPSEFIPIAESIGLISEIGEWVLMEACHQAVQWPDHLFVAINLSPQQFHHARIIDSVSRAILTSGINPSRVELEVTEGLLMEDTDEITRILRELKQMGVSIALDDFGTGYSSLSYLLKFPFDKLKIDRSFISSIETDKVARNVLEAIAKLGNVLNLKVTAEGVETLDQVDALKDFDCTHFQGFLFGKPLNEVDLATYLLNEFLGAGTLRSAGEHANKPQWEANEDESLQPDRRTA